MLVLSIAWKRARSRTSVRLESAGRPLFSPCVSFSSICPILLRIIVQSAMSRVIAEEGRSLERLSRARAPTLGRRAAHQNRRAAPLLRLRPLEPRRGPPPARRAECRLPSPQTVSRVIAQPLRVALVVSVSLILSRSRHCAVRFSTGIRVVRQRLGKGGDRIRPSGGLFTTCHAPVDRNVCRGHLSRGHGIALTPPRAIHGPGLPQKVCGPPGRK